MTDWRLADSGARERKVQYFLVERTGFERQVFGPYSLSQAKGTSGKRYMVISGPTLENGQKFKGDALQTAIRAGSVRIQDGSSTDGL